MSNGTLPAACLAFDATDPGVNGASLCRSAQERLQVPSPDVDGSTFLCVVGMPVVDGRDSTL